MSNNVNINGATDRTSYKCHKIYKDNPESLNKSLLPESYFMRNILDLSAIMALGNLKPNIILQMLNFLDIDDYTAGHTEMERVTDALV